MNLELILNLAIRSFAPPLICLVVLSLWRKSSASTRRVGWLLAFFALAALPLALLSVPQIQFVRPLPATTAPTSATLMPTSEVATTPQQPSAEIRSNQLAITPEYTQHAALTTPLPVRSKFLRWQAFAQIGLAVWLAGSFFLVAQWVVGLVRLSKLALLPIHKAEFLSDLSSVSDRLGLAREPLLMECPDVTVPMVFGVTKPRLVVPSGSDAWPSQTRQAIFIHECAHIRRRDCLWLGFSRLVCAVYWFNPMVWLAARQFRAECEAAADDTVLLEGVGPGLYAQELLQIAVGVRPSTMVGAVAMLEVGPLKSRIARLLEKNRSRASASPLAIGFSLVLSAALAAAMGLTYRSVDGDVLSHDGSVDLGNGNHLRIIAIVERTKTGTRAWNMRGELLPDSVPLPDMVDAFLNQGKPQLPQPSVRYIVFAQSGKGNPIEAVGPDSFLPPAPFQDVMSRTPGMGFSVTRIDGDSLSVGSILSNGQAYGSIHCRVPGEKLVQVDEMKPGGVANCSHQTPIRWSISGNAQVEWKDSHKNVIITDAAVKTPPRPGYKPTPLHNTNIDVDIPDAWSGKEVVFDVRSAGAVQQCSVVGKGHQRTGFESMDPRSITSVTMETRSRGDIEFDHIPMDPSNKVADSADLDLPSLQISRDEKSAGVLLGIGDPRHPKWGFWRPDGSPLPKIAGLEPPHGDGANLPIGNADRQVEFLFRTGTSNTDAVSASDVSGILLAGGTTICYTPSGRYDIEPVFVDPHVRSFRLVSKVPGADSVVAKISLKRAPHSPVPTKVAEFFSNRIGPGAELYMFSPKIAPPKDLSDRSLDFLYSAGPAPVGAVDGYSTDWEDGAVEVNGRRSERLVGANVLEHGYNYFTYPNVALYPKSN